MFKHNATIQAIDADNNRLTVIQNAVFTSGICSFTRQSNVIEKVAIEGLRGYFFVVNERDFNKPEKVTAEKAALKAAHEKAIASGTIKWHWQNADGDQKQVSRKSATNVPLVEIAKLDGVTIDYEYDPETRVDLILSYKPADADAVATVEFGRKNAAEKVKFAVERKTSDGKLIDRIIVEFKDDAAVKNHLKELDGYADYNGKHASWLKVPKMFNNGIEGALSKDAVNGESSVVIRKALDNEKPKATAKPKTATPKRQRATKAAQTKVARDGRRK